MRTTYVKYIIIVFLFAISFKAMADDSVKMTAKDSLFKLVLNLSAGYTSSSDSNFMAGGFSPSFRIMWEPNHRLNIGIETGFMVIEQHRLDEQEYELGSTTFRSSLKAIPILAVFNMEIWKIDVYGGMGVSYVWSTLEAFNEKVVGEQWNYSLMLSYGYTYMFNDYFGLGIESKTYFFTKLNKIVGGIELKMNLSILEW